MQDDDLRAACLDLMATAPVVYLATIGDDGYPRMRAMLNLRNRSQYPDHMHLYEHHDQDFMVFLATNTGSSKRRELEANPGIGLYYCHPEAFFGLSLIGDVEIVDDPGVKEAVWADGWERYYPQTGGPDDPDYTLLRLLPRQAQGWRDAQRFAFEPRR
jgi:general stress protein 26